MKTEEKKLNDAYHNCGHERRNNGAKSRKKPVTPTAPKVEVTEEDLIRALNKAREAGGYKEMQPVQNTPGFAIFKKELGL